MSIRAKFLCHSVEKHAGGQERVKLGAVYGEKGTANASWAKATPAGALEMTIDNPDAQSFIRPGYAYYLDITDVGPE